MTFKTATWTRSSLRLVARAQALTESAARQGRNGPMAAYFPMFSLSSRVRS
jgi:hypothetical protein